MKHSNRMIQSRLSAVVGEKHQQHVAGENTCNGSNKKRRLNPSRLFLLLSLTLLLGCTAQRQASAEQQQEILYVGTYSVRGSEGIYSYSFDRKRQQFTLLETVTTPDSPTFLELSPSSKFLYSVNRVGVKGEKDVGSVSAFAINPKTGRLIKINESSSFGESPCHVNLSRNGRQLYVSHYAGGSLSVFELDKNGAIARLLDTLTHTGKGTNPQRQEKPHVHAIQHLPGTDYFLVADLGLDRLDIYEMKKGNITPAPLDAVQTEPGSGPRHFSFLPSMDFLYVAEELSNTVSVHELNLKNHQPRQIQRLSTLPEGFKEKNTVADIHFSPDGKFLYVSNRGHDSLAIYAVNKQNGQLTLIGHQKTGGEVPRNFLIDKQGEFILVAHQNTDNITFFKRNADTGLLESTAIELQLPSPVCLKMLNM